MGGEVTEPAHSEEGVPQDQQRPAFAHHFERPGQRALLPGVVLSQRHAVSIAGSGSLTEPRRSRYSRLGTVIEPIVQEPRMTTTADGRAPASPPAEDQG